MYTRPVDRDVACVLLLTTSRITPPLRAATYSLGSSKHLSHLRSAYRPMKTPFAAAVAACAIAVAVGQSADEDLVTTLPGAEGMGFTNQYAGYLDLPNTEKHVCAHPCENSTHLSTIERKHEALICFSLPFTCIALFSTLSAMLQTNATH